MTNDQLAASTGGGLFGLISSIKIWGMQVVPNVMQTPVYVEVALKIFTTIFISVIGGVCGLLAKDLYVYMIKPKIFK